jgi:hypothetical protein
MVPSLPGKKVIGKLDREFITERMHVILHCSFYVASIDIFAGSYFVLRGDCSQPMAS